MYKAASNFSSLSVNYSVTIIVNSISTPAASCILMARINIGIVIEVAYGRFKNAGMQFAEAEQFLPVKKLEKEPGASKTRADYIFEPDKESLLDHLVPSILQTQFQKFLLDTHASEHGARMTAMEKASENAEEMLKELKITYNKARQESITRELSEIVGGAAALEGG